MSAKNLRKLQVVLKGANIEGNCLKGEPSVMGNLDSYYDVIMPGAFTDEVLEEFMQSGFIALNHDWDKVIGIPTKAEVRGQALYGECEFHTTADAQEVRTKCAERMAAGKDVGLSIGFSVMPDQTKRFPSGEALLAWARSAGYDMSLLDVTAISQHRQRCQALVKIARLYEWSPVPIPANPAANATEVKREDMTHAGTIQHAQDDNNNPTPVDPHLRRAIERGGRAVATKGEYLGDGVEAEALWTALRSISSALSWNAIYPAVFGVWECAGMSAAERIAYVEGALAEFSATTLTITRALMDLAVAGMPEGSDDDYDEDEYFFALRQKAQGLLDLYFPRDPDQVITGPVAMQAEAALAAASAISERMLQIHTLRQESGRKLGASAQDSLRQLADRLQGAADAVRDTCQKMADPPDTAAQERDLLIERLRLQQELATAGLPALS